MYEGEEPNPFCILHRVPGCAHAMCIERQISNGMAVDTEANKLRKSPGMRKTREQTTVENKSDSFSALQELMKETEREAEIMDRDFYISLFKLAVDTWKTELCHTWSPIDPSTHECKVQVTSIKKNTTYNQATVCKIDNDMKSNRDKIYCKMDNIKAKLFYTANGEWHMCVEKFCERESRDCGTMSDLAAYKSLHSKLEKEFTEIYVCTRTAKPHYCGVYCEYIRSTVEKVNDKENGDSRFDVRPVTNEDFTFVCPLTGLMSELQEIRGKIHIEASERHDFKQKYYDYVNNPLSKKQRRRHEPIEDIDSVINKSLQRTSFVLASSMNDKKELQQLNSTADSKKKKGSTRARLLSRAKTSDYMENRQIQLNQSFKQYYLTLAAEKVASFLSPDRVLDYVKKLEKNQPKLLKMFQNYATKCTQHGRVMNACHLAEIVRQENKSIYVPPDISNIPKDAMKDIVLQYSRICVNMWYIIRTKTREGVNSPEKFYFPDFVDNILILMKNGIQVEGELPGLLYTILKSDDFLNILPNSEHEERKKGDQARKIIRKSNTKMKKEIKNAIINAVSKEKVNPSELTPYHLDVEELEERHFIDIDSCFGRKEKGGTGSPKKKRRTDAPEIIESEGLVEMPQIKNGD